MKRDYEEQYEYAVRTERNNEYGIMKDSTLTVTVIECKDLVPMDYGGTSDPYCILEVGNKVIETSIKKKNLNPHWDESFSFPIETGKEILTITVMDEDKIKSDDFEGRIQIRVSELANQKTKEQWYDLKAPDGATEWKGKISLRLLWVHSKKDMLNDLIAEQEQEVSYFQENLEYYEDRQSMLDLILNINKNKNHLTTPNIRVDRSTFDNTSKLATVSPIKSEFDESTLAKLVGTVLEREQQWALSFERTSNKLSFKLGFGETPWYWLFQIGMYVSILLTFS